MREDEELERRSLVDLQDTGLDKVWVGVTASRLSHVQNREMSRFLGRLADLLRM